MPAFSSGGDGAQGLEVVTARLGDFNGLATSTRWRQGFYGRFWLADPDVSRGAMWTLPVRRHLEETPCLAQLTRWAHPRFIDVVAALNRSPPTTPRAGPGASPLPSTTADATAAMANSLGGLRPVPVDARLPLMALINDPQGRSSSPSSSSENKYLDAYVSPGPVVVRCDGMRNESRRSVVTAHQAVSRVVARAGLNRGRCWTEVL